MQIREATVSFSSYLLLLYSSLLTLYQKYGREYYSKEGKVTVYLKI
ncbi:hypothetical protein IIM_03799 [Bacillus cereus VD107]|nr:hypothetical protein IIM_03799 [Bacillus cereus VD107]